MVNRVPHRFVWPSRHLLHRKITKGKSKEDIKYYFFSFMKISNVTVTSKQNFTEKYRLMKNLHNQNCSWENKSNINRLSEISKIHSLHGFFLLQPIWIFHLSNKIFRKHLKLYIIQPFNNSLLLRNVFPILMVNSYSQI